jgi:hypothetical protein
MKKNMLVNNKSLNFVICIDLSYIILNNKERFGLQVLSTVQAALAHVQCEGLHVV